MLTPEQEAVYGPIRERVLAAERSAGGNSSAAADPDAGEGGAPLGDLAVAGCEPFDVDFSTVGEFYHKIESASKRSPRTSCSSARPTRRPIRRRSTSAARCCR